MYWDGVAKRKWCRLKRFDKKTRRTHRERSSTNKTGEKFKADPFPHIFFYISRSFAASKLYKADNNITGEQKRRRKKNTRSLFMYFLSQFETMAMYDAFFCFFFFSAKPYFIEKRSSIGRKRNWDKFMVWKKVFLLFFFFFIFAVLLVWRKYCFLANRFAGGMGGNGRNGNGRLLRRNGYGWAFWYRHDRYVFFDLNIILNMLNRFKAL